MRLFKTYDKNICCVIRCVSSASLLPSHTPATLPAWLPEHIADPAGCLFSDRVWQIVVGVDSVMLFACVPALTESWSKVGRGQHGQHLCFGCFSVSCIVTAHWLAAACSGSQRKFKRIQKSFQFLFWMYVHTHTHTRTHAYTSVLVSNINASNSKQKN